MERELIEIVVIGILLVVSAVLTGRLFFVPLPEKASDGDRMIKKTVILAFLLTTLIFASRFYGLVLSAGWTLIVERELIEIVVIGILLLVSAIVTGWVFFTPLPEKITPWERMNTESMTLLSLTTTLIFAFTFYDLVLRLMRAG